MRILKSLIALAIFVASLVGIYLVLGKGLRVPPAEVNGLTGRLRYLRNDVRNRLTLPEAVLETDPERVEFNDPCSVVVDRSGRVYLTERRHHVIRRLVDGSLETIAGTFRGGYGGDGGKAVLASLHFPEGLALDGAGNLFVADSANHRVRVIDVGGRISTYAGIGIPGLSGDGGQAREAKLDMPMDVAVDASGCVFIADWGNHCIRVVNPDGAIATIAGTQEQGFGGDGGPAVEAMLDGPYGIAVDAGGNLYIADSGNHRIRLVDPSGQITTIAGTGEAGFSGDGGPATTAELDSPQALCVSAQGQLYVNDEHNNRIRKIDGQGMITTVAGNGAEELCGDGGPATLACLYDPEDIWFDADQNLYLADGDNHRLRKISVDGIISTIAGSGPSGRK